MKHKIIKLMGVLSIILLSCTLLCGIWVGTHEVSDIAFHAQLSAVAVVVAIITQIVYMSKCRFCKKILTDKR